MGQGIKRTLEENLIILKDKQAYHKSEIERLEKELIRLAPEKFNSKEPVRKMIPVNRTCLNFNVNKSTARVSTFIDELNTVMKTTGKTANELKLRTSYHAIEVYYSTEELEPEDAFDRRINDERCSWEIAQEAAVKATRDKINTKLNNHKRALSGLWFD